MAYSDFSLETVIDEFELSHERVSLFKDIPVILLSHWLKKFLDLGLELALSSGTEKARSEFIIAPILLDLEERNPEKLFIFSGKSLEVDKSKGLSGECDFILTRSRSANVIQAPVFALVEAKKQDIELGLGQCSAQMVAAQIFNQRQNNAIDTIFGCVTTGEIWQFLKLSNRLLQIENRTYYINEIEKILGILQSIFEFYG